jgi:ribonuclease P protein component
LKTIKSSAEITHLFKEGRRVGTKDITLIVMRNEEEHDQYGRAAFIAGKKLGNAVWRNRAKRRMRALCKELQGPFAGYDVLFVARRSVNEASFEEMKQKTEHALVKAGIILV